MHRTEGEWRQLAGEMDARLEYKEGQYHFALTSPDENLEEVHSEGYFDGKIFLNSPVIAGQVADDLTELLLSEMKQNGLPAIHWVVGLEKPLVENIATNLTVLTSRPCLWTIAKKEGDSRNKKISFKDPEIFRDRNVLICDDTFSSGGTLGILTEIVEKNGGYVLPVYPVICNRSGGKRFRGRQIISLVRECWSSWPASKCPPCKNDSRAIRPRSEEGRKLLRES